MFLQAILLEIFDAEIEADENDLFMKFIFDDRLHFDKEKKVIKTEELRRIKKEQEAQKDIKNAGQQKQRELDALDHIQIIARSIFRCITDVSPVSMQCSTILPMP